MQKLRNQRLAAIHMGKAHLGMDDDTYRDMLEQIGGCRSAKDLDTCTFCSIANNFRPSLAKAEPGILL